MTTPTTVQVRFQFRADTAANWTTIDPVLLANELGRETDTGKIKIGDGTTAWSSLAYQGWSSLTYPLVNADIDAAAAIDHSKLANIAAGSVLLGNASNVPTATALSGDVTVNSSGVTAIGSGVIVDADVSATAEIAVSKLANGTANQILTTDGTDVSWTDSPTIAGNVIISGNLTVNGTETIINVDTLQVEDKTIEMGNVVSPSDLTADGGGIVLKGATDKTILWVDSTDSWTSSENVDLASGKTYKIAGTDVLSATTLGSGVTGSSLTSVGNLTDLTVDTTTLVVDATNNRVGVGTASPNVNLHISGTGAPALRIQDADGTTQFLNVLHNTGVTTFEGKDGTGDGVFRFRGASTLNEYLRIEAAGRLLVGATSFTGPTKLVVRGNSSASTGSGNAYLVRGESSADMADDDVVGLIRFSDQDNNRCAEIRSSIDGTPSASASPGDLSFWTTAASSVSSTQRMTIDSSGNVGIGNVSPSAPLQVQGSAGEIRIQRPTASQSDWSMKLPSSSGEYQIYDNNNTTARLTIDSSGNVGIGHVSPAQLLDVNGDALINGLTIGKGAGSLGGNTAIGESVLGNATTGGINNVGVGYLALEDLTTGEQNTAVGRGAGPNITTGDNNTFVGRSSGFDTTEGGSNTALGEGALYSNVAGNNGTAIGRRSQLYANNTATSFTNTNVSVGYESLRGSTTAADNTGVANVAVGYQVLRENTTGSTNTAIGNVALFLNTTGLQNVAMGGNSLVDNTTGSNNTAIGVSALANNVGGNNGVAIGLQSQLFYNNTTTSHSNTNTAVGYQSLRGSTTPADNTGTGNVAVGYQAIYDNTSGTNNVAVGNLALSNNTSGLQNIAVGTNALASNTTGANNVAIGMQTISTSTVVDQCTAVGYESQRYSDSTTTNKDANNTSVGFRALRGSATAADNTGVNNTAIGAATMQLNTSGDNNTAVGGSALSANTTGGTNTAVGLYALIRNTTGSNNSALGYNAGRYDQDNNDTANFTNCTYLGQNTRASGDNQVQLGNTTTTTYAYGSVQDRSDERDKTDIRDTVIGLDFINTLRPVDFRWDMRDDYVDTEIYEEEETETVEVPNPAYVEDGDEPQYIKETRTKMVTKDRLVPVPKDGSRKRNRFHHGLIAQEVKAAADAAGVDFAGYQDHKVGGGKDVLTLGYSELIAPLIKAVQELSAENAALKARLDALEGV